MPIPKPTEVDRERFRAVVPEEPGVEIKPMFGNLGAYINGNERPMGGYVTLPANWTGREAKPWIMKALAVAAARLPKQPKRKPAKK